MTDRLADLTAQGVSLWLDDLSRQRLHSGNLKDLIGTWHISGVTTNPSIFQAALANARLAYQAFEKTFTGPRWEAWKPKGANKQRPLWASTGVKDPQYDDTRYVVELVAPGTINHRPGEDHRSGRRPRRDHRQHHRRHQRPGRRRLLLTRSRRSRPERRVRGPGDRGRRQIHRLLAGTARLGFHGSQHQPRT